MVVDSDCWVGTVVVVATTALVGLGCAESIIPDTVDWRSEMSSNKQFVLCFRNKESIKWRVSCLGIKATGSTTACGQKIPFRGGIEAKIRRKESTAMKSSNFCLKGSGVQAIEVEQLGSTNWEMRPTMVLVTALISSMSALGQG